MAFWRPGSVGPGQHDRETERDLSSAAAADLLKPNPNSRLTLQQQRGRLPVAAVKDRLITLLESYQVLIVAGSTGSGKTTQIPQYLDEAIPSQRGGH